MMLRIPLRTAVAICEEQQAQTMTSKEGKSSHSPALEPQVGRAPVRRSATRHSATRPRLPESIRENDDHATRDDYSSPRNASYIEDGDRDLRGCLRCGDGGSGRDRAS